MKGNKVESNKWILYGQEVGRNFQLAVSNSFIHKRAAVARVDAFVSWTAVQVVSFVSHFIDFHEYYPFSCT